MLPHINLKRPSIIQGLCLLVLLASVRTARLADPDANRYYMIVLSAQAEPNIVRKSHTFAVFAQVSGQSGTTAAPSIQAQCISWMPRGLNIRPLLVDPVPGVNLDLMSTIRWANSVQARIELWGPYPIEKELYEKAVKRAQQLESGSLQYICLDRHFRTRDACNCIHAVSDLDDNQSLLETGTAHGFAAGEMVLDHFRKYVLPNKKPADWLLDRLDLRLPEVENVTARRAASGQKEP
jgi:hypothetical protein